MLIMKMKRKVIFLILAGCAVAFRPLSFAQEFSEKEEAAIRLCEFNITKGDIGSGKYSPADAQVCIAALQNDNYRLFEKLKRADGARLTRIVEYSEMFKELGQFYSSDVNRCVIREKMILLFDHDREENACALCGLELGPEPEKFMPWVQTYANKLYIRTEFGIYTWDILEDKYKLSLSSQGYSEETWKKKTVSQRIATMIADDIIAARTPDFMSTENKTCGVIKGAEEVDEFLDRYLDPQMHAKYLAYREQLKKAATAAAPAPGATTSSGKVADMTDKVRSGKDLGAVFDGSNQSGTAPSSFGGWLAGLLGKGDYSLATSSETDAVGVLLQNHLMGKSKDGAYSGGELKGTKVGDGLLAMYNAKKDGVPETPLKLKVIKYRSDLIGAAYCPQAYSTCGGMNPGPGEIALNKTMIEQWMKENHVSAKELLDPKNDEYMKRLARHVAPTFVHEATHQRDDKWARDRGLPFKYTLDDEVGTFSAQSLFLKEKLADPKTEALYMKDMRDFDNEILQTVETNGARGVKQKIRYYNLHGIEGESSKSFAQVGRALKEQGLRKTVKGYSFPKSDSKLCWEGQPEQCSDAQLQKMVDKTYSWYQQATKKQRENVDFINTEINRLNREDKSGRANALYPSGVPEL